MLKYVKDSQKLEIPLQIKRVYTLSYLRADTHGLTHATQQLLLT